MSLRNELATAAEEAAETYQAIDRLWAEAPAPIDFDQLADLYYTFLQDLNFLYIEAHSRQLGNNVADIVGARERLADAEAEVNRAIREAV